MTHSKLGYPFRFLTFCSKLIQYMRMMAYVVRLSPHEGVQRMACLTISISTVKLEVNHVIMIIDQNRPRVTSRDHVHQSTRCGSMRVSRRAEVSQHRAMGTVRKGIRVSLPRIAVSDQWCLSLSTRETRLYSISRYGFKARSCYY